MKQHINIVYYMAKCCLACLIVYLARPILGDNNNNWIWFFISIILVQSPDNNEALPLAITRIKANAVASVVALLSIMAGFSGFSAIAISFCFTILFCYWRGMMAASRPALAAVVIILLHPEGAHVWDTALERSTFVILGCLVGVLIPVPFHWRNYVQLLQHRANKKTTIEKVQILE